MPLSPSAEAFAHVQRTSDRLAGVVAGRLDRTFALQPLLSRAVLPWPDCDPPTSFGFYASADGRAPDRIRLVFQPATDCEPDELRALLGPFGRAGDAAADLLDALGAEPGFDRGGWETAIGIDGDALRVYAGSSLGRPADVPDLERAGMWPPRLGHAAEALLAGTLGALVGCARRLGGASSWGIYLLAVAPFEEIELPVRPALLERFTTACGGVPALGPGRYGVQASLDERGELVDWKLDVRDPPPAFRELAQSEGLSPFLRWCDETAEDAGVGTQLSSASLRVSPAGESLTAYVQYLCPPSARF